MANIVQYIIVNKDIITKLGWPLGAVIAQCCHATTAVGHLYKEDEAVKTYFDDIDNMHKVVLEVSNPSSILLFSHSQLTQSHFHLNFRLVPKMNYENSAKT